MSPEPPSRPEETGAKLAAPLTVLPAMRSVGAKLSGVTCLVLAVVAAALFVVLSRHERSLVLASKENAALMVARLYSDSLSAPVLFGDADSVKEVIANLARNNEVVYAAVWPIDPGLPSRLRPAIAAMERGASGIPAPPFARSSLRTEVTHEWFLVETGVTDPQGKVVGMAQVAFSLARENEAIGSMERRVLLLSIGIAVVLSLVLLLLAQRLIVRPLAHLAVAAKRLEMGQPASIEVGSNDEIGSLAQALQVMSSAIDERTRQLEVSTGELIEAERKTAVAYYEREMVIARQIQTSILPRGLDVPGFEIAASMVTASEVGGDYYDLLRTEDGGFWLGIGDVSGHGLNSGLIMLMIQSGLATLMRRDPDADPASLLRLLNAMLYENVRVRLGRDDFATLSLLRLYPDGRFVAAGAHEDILIRRARTGRCEEIRTVGTWVGVNLRAGAQMTNQENRLEPGDVMLLYTDGITEAMSTGREQFELTRLAEVLEAAHAEPAEDVCQRILERVHGWSTERADDQTLVVVRRLAT
jgi:serine phosphatase RsbU (regulator of sigma subunit)